jgi:hypothetical protein
MIKNFKDYLVEETKEVFFTFGRMNPPTIGHGKVLDTIASKARGADWKVYVSHTTGPKDPLSYSDKIKHLRKMFPKYGRNIIVDKGVKNVFDIARVLYDAGYKRINMVVGQDRLREFDVLLNKYNGKKARHGFYNFESIKVTSAGQRDPDAEGVAGMSASKQRANAKDNNYQAFTLGVPRSMNDTDTRKLFKDVRKGLGLKEQTTFKNHIDLGKKDDTREAYVNGTLFELGDTVAIKESDEVGTVTVLGANYVIVECGERKLRKWLDAVQLVERQDPDIKDKKGTQPAKYYAKDAKGKEMSKSTKSKRDAHFKKGTAMDDDNPNAYKPAPGDKSAKTKPSKYTKDYEKMFGENAGEIGTDKLKKKYTDDTPLEELFGRNVDLSGSPFLRNFDGVVNKDVHVKVIRKWVRDTNKKDWETPVIYKNKNKVEIKTSDAEAARRHLMNLAKGHLMQFRELEKLLFKMIDNKSLPRGYDYRKGRTFMKADVTHDRKDLAKRITEARSKRLKK